MNRRRFILGASVGMAASSGLGGCGHATVGDTTSTEPVSNTTVWRVEPSAGLDACFALTIAAADETVLQVQHYPELREELRLLLGDDGSKKARRLMNAVSASGSAATPGPALARVVSAGGLSSLDDLIHTFKTDGVLEKGLKPTGMMESQRARENIARVRPIATAAFSALQQAGFEAWWAERYKPGLEEAGQSLADNLSSVDLVSELNRYRAETYNPAITVYVSELCAPHALKVIGQRFVTSPDYGAETIRRNAAHEMLHTLLTPGRPETQTILDGLSDDVLLRAVLAKADPAYGYTSNADSVRGIVEEGAVQALEAVLNEALGQGRDQAQYWREQDGGMHVFAVAVYARIKSSGYDKTGGDYLSWLSEQVSNGELRSPNLRAYAASVMGADSVSRWLDS